MIHHFQSLQHQKNLVTSKDRLELLKHVEARMNEDGLKQTKYQVVGRIETELFTKITVSLLYDEQLFSTKKKGIITNNVKNDDTASKRGTHSSLPSRARKALAKAGKKSNIPRKTRRYKSGTV